MLTFFIIVWLISLIFFAAVMIKEPRSLLSGISLLLFLFMSALFALLLLFMYSSELVSLPGATLILSLLAIFLIAAIAFFPVCLIGFFLIEGIKNIRHEGFRLSNLLSLGFGIFLILYLFGFPLVVGFSNNGFFTFLYFGVSAVCGFFLVDMTIYCISAFLNTIHPVKRTNIDEIIVLGSGILGTTITPLLKARVDRGIKLLNDQKDARLILSGGQGPGEDIPESQAMAEYAISQGVDPSLLVLEQKSKNTDENLRYSRKLFREDSKNIAVVTTRYHVFRALVLARRQNLKCKGYGSATKWYFALNATIREYIGYLSINRKKYLIISALLFIPFLLAALLFLFF